MAIATSDRLRGAARGTPAVALSHLDRPDRKDRDFLYAVYELAPQVFIDPAIVLAIFGHETGMAESPRWNGDMNPGGIGIVANNTPQPFSIGNARIAAMCFVSALNRLVKGTREEPWARQIPKPAADWLDTVWARHNTHGGQVERLSDMMRRFNYPEGDVGFTWAEDQQWADGVVRRAAQFFPALRNQSSATENDVVFGRVPEPAYLRMIVEKAGPGNGYSALAASRQLVGGVEHITAGLQTIEWYAEFFGINGERARDALVDFIIDADGRIAMLNEPWGFRSPWANGSTDGLEGDGPAFVTKFGINAVNDRLFSTEHIRRGSEAWPDAMVTATIEHDAFMFDGIGVRWDAFPLHQDFNVNTHLFHSEFTGKGGNGPDECPGAWIKQRENIDLLQGHIRARMKKFQTGVESAPSIPRLAEVPDVDLPGDWTMARASNAFGTMTVLRTDGKMVRRTFDPGNGLSLAWLQRVIDEKPELPPSAVRGFEFNYNGHGDKGASASFSNGWLAVMPSRRAGWRWADR